MTSRMKPSRRRYVVMNRDRDFWGFRKAGDPQFGLSLKDAEEYVEQYPSLEIFELVPLSRRGKGKSK